MQIFPFVLKLFHTSYIFLAKMRWDKFFFAILLLVLGALISGSVCQAEEADDALPADPEAKDLRKAGGRAIGKKPAPPAKDKGKKPTGKANPKPKATDPEERAPTKKSLKQTLEKLQKFAKKSKKLPAAKSPEEEDEEPVGAEPPPEEDNLPVNAKKKPTVKSLKKTLEKLQKFAKKSKKLPAAKPPGEEEEEEEPIGAEPPPEEDDLPVKQYAKKKPTVKPLKKTLEKLQKFAKKNPPTTSKKKPTVKPLKHTLEKLQKFAKTKAPTSSKKNQAGRAVSVQINEKGTFASANDDSGEEMPDFPDFPAFPSFDEFLQIPTEKSAPPTKSPVKKPTVKPTPKKTPPPTKKTTLPAKKTPPSPPAKKMTLPPKKTTPPAKKTTPPAKKTNPPAKKAPPPAKKAFTDTKKNEKGRTFVSAKTHFDDDNETANSQVDEPEDTDNENGNRPVDEPEDAGNENEDRPVDEPEDAGNENEDRPVDEPDDAGNENEDRPVDELDDAGNENEGSPVDEPEDVGNENENVVIESEDTGGGDMMMEDTIYDDEDEDSGSRPGGGYGRSFGGGWGSSGGGGGFNLGEWVGGVNWDKVKDGIWEAGKLGVNVASKGISVIANKIKQAKTNHGGGWGWGRGFGRKAQPSPFPGRDFPTDIIAILIKDRLTGSCLAPVKASTELKAHVQLDTCDPNRGQEWVVRSMEEKGLGNEGEVVLKNGNSKYCLQVKDETTLIQAKCKSGHKIYWKLEPTGVASGFHTIESVDVPGQCIDNRVGISPCNRTEEQKFTLIRQFVDLRDFMGGDEELDNEK